MPSRAVVVALAATLLPMVLAPSPLSANTSALRKLRKGDTVEAEGRWDRTRGIFSVTEIQKLPKPRRPSARGVLEAVDRRAGKLTIFHREVRVSGQTAFLSSSGLGGGDLSSLEPGMRVEVTAEVDRSGAWTATKVVWRDVKASDKVKGTITDLLRSDRSVETVAISGLPLRLTEKTELKTDYLQEELLDSLHADVGALNAPHLRLGRHLLLSGDVRPSARREAGYTLSGGDDELVTAEPALGLQLAGDWGRPFQTLVDVRFRSQHVSTGAGFDLVERELEARQAYAVLRLPGDRGAALVVGKQRVRDGREWLFDESLHGIRLYIYQSRPVVFEASYFPSLLAPASEKFATWDDLLLRARYIPDSRNEASVYFLKRRDSSPRRRQPAYWGLSYHGRPTRVLAGWLEAALLRGEDKGRPQRAWALDTGATLTARGTVRPSLTLAYAVGSGEEKTPGDPFSQEFRQTGYEDNSDRFGGFSNFKYYGEVLDPELSNLEVLTLGAGLRFSYSVSVDGIYHVYRQHRLDDELRGRLAPELNADFPDLGRELDLVLGVQNLWKRVSFSYAFGRFEPGDAFPARSHTVTLHRLSVRFAF